MTTICQTREPLVRCKHHDLVDILAIANRWLHRDGLVPLSTQGESCAESAGACGGTDRHWVHFVLHMGRLVPKTQTPMPSTRVTSSHMLIHNVCTLTVIDLEEADVFDLDQASYSAEE